jgi:hypothetical protein
MYSDERITAEDETSSSQQLSLRVRKADEAVCSPHLSEYETEKIVILGDLRNKLVYRHTPFFDRGIEINER